LFLKTRIINLISIIIATISVSLIFFAIFYTNKSNVSNANTINKSITGYKKNDLLSSINLHNSKIKQKIDYEEIKNKKWILKIDKIGLNAIISDGTDVNNLNKHIGHFKETVKSNGNVGLAAHNRGYKVNYFKNVKKLRNGDIIKYFYKGNRYVYKTYMNYIILDTDWTVLENEKNEITLITCVENKPTLRRCVKAKLIYKNNERIE